MPGFLETNNLKLQSVEHAKLFHDLECKCGMDHLYVFFVFFASFNVGKP